MKYRNLNQIIPKDKRKEINEKIIYVINNNLCDKCNLTNEIIFNSYTGEGGLSGVEFKDYGSFYEYTKAKQEIEQGQFFTPFDTLNYMINILHINENKIILDLTCGMGNVFNFIKNEFNCYGCEIDKKSYKIAKHLYPNANISCCDMREYNPYMKFDYIIGNPPFNLSMFYKGERKFSQMVFIEKSFELLKTSGIMSIIVPKSFLNDEFTNKSDIEYINDHFNFICQIPLENDTFKSLGVENFETKIIILQKKSKFIKDDKYKNNFVSGSANKIYEEYIKPLYDEIDNNRNKIYLENNIELKVCGDEIFKYKIRKMLFDIKRTKSIKDRYNECVNYYQLFLNQKQPDNLSYDEWVKIRITSEDVILKFKKILSNQHIQKKNVIKLVKCNYGLKEKDYSGLDEDNNKSITFNEMILNNNYPFKDLTYKKLYLKKLKSYNKQNIDFNIIKENISIKKWLDNLKIKDYEKEEHIKPNKAQKEIINKMLQKKYGYIQAEQGAGKTLMSLCYALYRKEYNNVKNTICVAPSIAINGTWIPTLEDYKIDFIVLNNIKDIDKIKRGQFVLITFNMLIKLKKHIKKYLKRISYKVTLIVDESDSICRMNSKRTKATLDVFKKCKYKLLLSGTMTRNNITESYSQFYLLYNSSINFLSENEFIYEEDKYDKNSLAKVKNNYYMKPFPAYMKGYKLFSESFNPKKITVFGVGKNTQNIYNSNELKKIINKTIITKTFEEVTGKNIYKLKQHVVKFNDSERNLYDTAINKFYSMKYLFTSTGNARKDRMMEIIQQITLMLHICQHPQTYKEYNCNDIPNKYLKVIDMLNKWDNEKVAIGCRSLKEIDCYTELIKKKYPYRKLFVITGDISMKERKNIIKKLKNIKNGILLCTQQSLSSSISIDYINKVIITALSWNYSTLSQFFFRFIRYTSKNNKEIHFITYENSLESNLLKLIMAKENLTIFMKNKEINENEMYDKLGIDFNLVDMLLTKEKDENGHVKITNWGEQEIL